MVRAAAKNNRDVAIVVRSSDYDRVIKEMDQHNGALTFATRFDLAVAAFEHTAAYDAAMQTTSALKFLITAPPKAANPYCRAP